jgi:UDP-N-acetyl-D-mannosaminuronic acid dehydrogenase
MVLELVSNDRIIGGMTEACSAHAQALYSSFVTAEAFLTDCRTAEFVKLIENSYRDVNIAFANETSAVCDQIGIDVWRVIELANRHPRVSILSPGAGVGGHCIAVDPWFVISAAPETTKLMRAARLVNNAKPIHLSRQIRDHAERFKTPVVACFGLSYKPDVEDLRESPALEIIHQLAADADLRVLVCDPFVTSLPDDLASMPNVSLATFDTAREHADIVAFLVRHTEFTKLPLELFSDKIVVDAVGLTRSPRSGNVSKNSNGGLGGAAATSSANDAGRSSMPG